ncbi:MAG: hypothetical protein N2Z85_00485, partial [Patescibacteria group bacterium]|nr:hypothetical protein [Patescibacteria group bacterium]
FLVLIILNFLNSPAFGKYDNTYLWLNEVSSKISKNKNYCVEYDIFKETFIEDKIRYMFSIQKNKPSKKCLDNAYVYYFCEPIKCNLEKFKDKKIENIKFNQEYYVKTYKIK